MQSYEHHILYESLEMRHPYMQEPFYRDIIPDQVSLIMTLRMKVSWFGSFVRSVRRSTVVGSA